MKTNKELQNESKRLNRALADAKGNKTHAAKLLGLKRTTFNYRLEKVNDFSNTEYFHNPIKKCRRYIITSVQNATPVHEGFFKSLKICAESNDAELLCIPFRYQNPTSIFNKSESWWDKSTVPYLTEIRQDLSDHLQLLGDVKIRPTTGLPLTGLESLSGHKCCIVGHTKIAMQMVPTSADALPKIMWSTGSLTLPNYTDSKEGKKGEFHHSQAALLVEIDSNGFPHVRHLNAHSDGSFTDLDYDYTPEGIRKASPAAGIVLGDLHYPFVDQSVMDVIFKGKKSIRSLLKPKAIVFNDAHDFYCRNHHHLKDPFNAIAKQQSGHEDVRGEILNGFEYINDLLKSELAVFPRSNHPDALARWVREQDWKTDPVNSLFYLETALYMAKGVTMTNGGARTPDPYSWWGSKILKNALFLKRNESYKLAGIKVDLHGHEGANGARGNLNTYSKLSDKTVTGHSHGPGIRGGAYAVGLSANSDLEYVGPLSSWAHTLCIITAKGKRQLITIVNGKFTI